MSVKPDGKQQTIPVPVSTKAQDVSRCSLWRQLVALGLVCAAVYYLFVSPAPENLKNAAQQEDVRWIVDFVKHKRFGERAEKAFLAVPSESSVLATSRHYTAKPHIAGSEQDLQTAKDVLKHLESQLGITPGTESRIFDAGSAESRSATLGITSLNNPTAWIDVYYPVLNLPLERSLEIMGDNGQPTWSANLKEIVEDDTDAIAHQYADFIPTFHGLSKGGVAEGHLVYGNLGRKEDYDALVESGVEVKGKIVIVRYGGIFRGLKVKFAQELGAAAVLIYSDPRDDGSVTVANGYEPYPHGPARNPTSVQRGSVQFLSLYPGDPTTPGYPSYPNATRTEGLNIPEIPSLPISWSNAERLLEELGDAKGVSSNLIRLVNNVDTKVTPIWNTMGVIPGHIKDEVVVIGNHRDAWVLGAADPTSGTASLNEVIKGYGALLKTGWKPLRTLVFASWDAEEYGLIGSTEYGEDFPEWIKDNVVAYINLDSSVAGSRFRTSASPSLADLVQRTADSVVHPTDSNRTLWDARSDVGKFFGPVSEEVVEMYAESAKVSSATGVGALGSGSDYTVFLQRIGVASIDQSFSSTLSDAVYHYHSIYDSQHWQETYADRGFHKHVAMARHVGLLGLRLADGLLLPINTTRYCTELELYLQKVETLAKSAHINIDLKPLQNSIGDLLLASESLDKAKAKVQRKLEHLLRKGRKPSCLWGNIRCRISKVISWLSGSGGHCSGGGLSKLHRLAKQLRAINKKLSSFERGFISSSGIKDREWYKHLVTAPGKNLGYGATTLPALTESITIENNSTLAEVEVERLRGLITRLATVIAD